MATNNITYPQSPFLDAQTGRPSREWLLWLQNPNYAGVNVNNIVPVIYGGTGLSQVPLAAQLLIGTGSGFVLNALTSGTGITVGGSSGNVTISLSNSGVTAGSYGSGSQIPTFTVNAKGQVTAAVNTTIGIPYTQVTGLGTIVTQNLGASGTFKSGDPVQKTVTVVNGKTFQSSKYLLNSSKLKGARSLIDS